MSWQQLPRSSVIPLMKININAGRLVELIKVWGGLGIRLHVQKLLKWLLGNNSIPIKLNGEQLLVCLTTTYFFILLINLRMNALTRIQEALGPLLKTRWKTIREDNCSHSFINHPLLNSNAHGYTHLIPSKQIKKEQMKIKILK